MFSNPLIEQIKNWKTAEPCVLVIFGATGDLTARKLVPALYSLAADGELPAHFACVGFARRDKSQEDFRKELHDALQQFSRTKPIDEGLWSRFSQMIHYHRADYDKDEGYEGLKKLLSKLDETSGTKGNRLYYLSIHSSDFATVIEKLGQHKLFYPINDPTGKWSRVIIEKPFGHDLETAKELQEKITRYLDEKQIYRIDHYLGKETVQNLMVFRFSNPLFEALWNNRHIDHVQITVSEEIGIGTRGNLWEGSGMVRDIVQNHMMQLLSLIAMEPPKSVEADAIHDEKVKVLQSLRPFPEGKFDDYIVRGQYAPGFINGKPVIGYREENNVAPDSNIETYAAMELFIDNPRWSGVPFYLRAGKRLPKKITEIAITFKTTSCDLFKDNPSKIGPNILAIRIQPDEGISLKMNCKVPGQNSPIQPVKMDFQYSSYFGSAPPEAYERLICDAMAGDSTLFARMDEVLASWELFSPVLHQWEKTKAQDFPNYSSGTWGPQVAEAMIARGGRKWRLL